MRQLGRQSKLTPALHQMIVQAVTLGVSVVTAAQYAGVDKATVLEWIARGEGRHCRARTKPYADFADAITHARAVDEVRRLARLEQAAKGGHVIWEKTVTFPNGKVLREVRSTPPDPQVDEWVLERSRAETWGRKDKLDLRLLIEQAATKVADELGLTPQEVLLEATLLLKETHTDDTQNRSTLPE